MLPVVRRCLQRHLISKLRDGIGWQSGTYYMWRSSSTSSKASEWSKAVSEAEKIVGYSTSFLSLRCLLSDELSNVAVQMRKLVGTTHPLLKTVRQLFYDGKHNMQTRGLLVLLMSKAAGPAVYEVHCDEVLVSGIYHSQRTLAEITEMIHTASLIHKGVVNIKNTEQLTVAQQQLATSTCDKNSQIADLEFGNKMAILSGDFLLANASKGLASLNNTKVVEMISTAIGDLMQAEFTQLRDRDGGASLPKDGATVEDWELQTFLASGSLIAHSCSAALTLASHSEVLQKNAFEFGRQIAFAYQICEEIQELLGAEVETTNKLSLTSTPVLLYVNSPRCDNRTRQSITTGELTYKNVMKLVLQDAVVLQEARRLRDSYCRRALDTLKCLSNSDARTALQNIIRATVAV